MSSKPLNQKGFTALETVLIIVVLAVIGGAGYYVYHQNHKTKTAQTQNSASKTDSTASSQASKPASKTKYLSIKEWGVQAPVTNGDTLTYKFDSGSQATAMIISQKLSQNYDCKTYGAGGISRYKGTDPASDSGLTAKSGQTVAQYAQTASLTYKHLGDYYYFFDHDQAACGNITAGTNNPTDGEDAQQAANAYTESLVTELQPIP